MSKMMIVLISLALLTFIPTQTTQAATFSVCTLGELTSAITSANGNTQADTINFNCDTTLNFTSGLSIVNDGAGNGITINSNGNTVIFDGGGSTRFFTVNSGASLTLDGFTLQNGNSAPSTSSGGAIVNNGTLSITNSTFTGNSTGLGYGGGAIVNDGTLNIGNSTFTGNSAGVGGAIYTLGTLNISNSTFTNNSANSGGAIGNYSASVVSISNSTFTNNSATNGGAIENDSTLTITNSTFSNNTATNGGAIYNTGTASSQDSNYVNNTCTANSITNNGGNHSDVASVGCPDTPDAPDPVAPEIVVPVVDVLGCALDTADGLDIFNAPDNTYCRVLMRNGGVVGYSGAIPAQLINLGVILAVDVYRLEGGMSVNTFPNYARVCLAGQGRLFYMDSRNAPRGIIELATEIEGSLTCGWIPAPGTLILTN